MNEDYSKSIDAALKHLSVDEGTSAILEPRGSPLSDSFQITRKYIEADMSDFNFPLRKQCSTSFLRPLSSSSQPNLVAKDDTHLFTNTPSPSVSHSPPKRVSMLGQDITENDEKYMKMDPADLLHFRKWMVGFCIVNFDLEIGQGKLYLVFGDK